MKASGDRNPHRALEGRRSQHGARRRSTRTLVLIWATCHGLALGHSLRAMADSPSLEAGLAVREITPSEPIRLAGYAARNKPSEKLDYSLVVQALALRNSGADPFVFVCLDNCEVSPAFIQPVLAGIASTHHLPTGAVMVVSSHTHSAPVLARTLETMYELREDEKQQIDRYSSLLNEKIREVVGAALKDLKPAILQYGLGRATFAINRRVFQGGKVAFGENYEGPVDWDVPVLAVRGTNQTLRGVLFGYACHGTSIAGDDFYIVSGDYMAYARKHLEDHYPGTVACYLTGMGADSNPSPRGTLLDAKRHGLELAGVVVGVLNRPMRPVNGLLRYAYSELDLPLHDPPTTERLEKDAQSTDIYVRKRAELAQRSLKAGRPLPASLKLPMAAIRLGDDLLFLAMGGEVVVDYALKFKRLFAAENPWTIGYAYEVPCYIPSQRVLLEGGYEADSSLIYYGIYGPFRPTIEDILVKKMGELVKSLP